MGAAIILLLFAIAFALLAMLNAKRLFLFVVAAMILIIPIANVSFMPRTVLGITGLNVGNIVWLVAFGTAVMEMSRRAGTTGYSAYFIPPVAVFVVLYLIAVTRTIFDVNAISGLGYPISYAWLAIENLVKPAQIILAGWIVFAFCRVEGNIFKIQRMLCIVPIVIAPLEAYYFFLGGGIGGGYAEGRNIISESIGYHANELGAVGTYLLATIITSKESAWRMVRYIAIGASLLIIALSFSRMAYVTTIVLLGLTFFKLKVADRVILVSLAVVIIVAFSAQLVTRVSVGVDSTEKIGINSSKIEADINTVSAGRIDGLWLPLLPHLMDNVVIGDGIYSILKSPGASLGMPLHPHNAYMQVALDMGFIGIVVLLWMVLKFRQLGKQTSETGFTYVLLCWLMMGFTGHSFYPMYANFLVWVTFGLALGARSARLINTVPKEKISVVNRRAYFVPRRGKV